jgi:DNA helicase-2/ATP-dependent DNA helicase PcrA
VVKDCLKEMKIESRELKPESVLKMICHAKENLLPPDDYRPPDPRLRSILPRIYKLYNRKLAEYNALDFDDLIFTAVRLFQSDPAVLRRYQERFHYILVDEYQDTNRAQYALTKLLAQKYRNLCVVGDDDQSIYSWRGAEIRNILDFEKDYPDTTVIKLEQNYRSTKTILKAASAVVRHNAQRKAKTLWCDNEPGEKVEYYEAYDDKNEANYVVKKVIEQGLSGSDLGRIAVFYRLNYQSRVFEEFFVKYKVPYEVVGALKFYDRAEVKNILAYLKVVGNPRDLISLKRIVNLPIRGIGFESLERVGEFAGRQRIPFFDALRKADAIEGLKPRARAGIRGFVGLIEKFIALKDRLNPYELAIQVAKESGYLDSLAREQTEEEYTRRKNVEQLLISINDFVKTFPDKRLDDYLENVMLRSNIDEWQGVGRVSLMTLHNAKGLEFDTVFITGLEDGILPHYRSYEENRYEEERRLFYVGITRARKKLFLTSASQRESYRGGFQVTETSPFLREVPDDIFASALIPEDL